MKKNTSGQFVGAQLCSATDGSDFTGAVTVYVTGNAGTQAVGSVGSGACVHEGNGFHTYAPSQAETNYDHVGFTFKGTGAITATVQVYPSFPQTGDNFALIGTAGAGLTSLASAANLATVAGYLDTEVAAILAAVDTEVSSILTTLGVAGAGLTAIPWGATWYAAAAAGVWNAGTASYGTAGSYGLLVETNLDVAVSSVSGGGTSDWTANEKTAIRSILGIPASGTTPDDPTVGIMDTIRDAAVAIKAKTDFLPSVTAGAAGGVFIAGSNAATTVNITGTITTVTNLTNLPSITAGWITAAGIAASALNGKGDWNVGKTGYSLTQGFPANFASLSITAGGLVDITQAAADKAWGTAARVLTAGTNIALAKGTGITGFNDLDAAGVATAVWNAATATYGPAGSYGLLVETNLDAQVSSVGGGSLTAANIADAVWDELLSGHAIVGSTGEALTSSGSGGGGVADWTSDERIVIRSVLGIPGSGTTPADPTTGILDTIRDAAVAIKTKTDGLPADPADASDIAAAFAVTNGKIDVVDDLLDTEIAAIKAETASIQVDTNDIQARLPAALVGGRMDSNLSAISNSTATMAAFNRAVKGNVIGTIGAGSTTTSIVTSSVTPAGSVADKFKGRLLVFADDTTTANLRGQATDITANTSAAAPTLTVTALTTAPVAGDTFCVV